MLAVGLAVLALAAVSGALWVRLNASRSQNLPLASFIENDVSVNIWLERAGLGQAVLVATFTPTEQGYHLYSKDLPAKGVNGLGRPTRLDLTAFSALEAAGVLEDEPQAEPVTVLEGSPPLPVYPPGPVTLRLPVKLPDAPGWVDDLISVSYMTCSKTGCTRPVIGREVEIRVPGANTAWK